MARREIDPHFGLYVHMQHLPRANEALDMLKKIASAVKPIMRKRNWKVGKLAEFMPEQWNLLGLNVNHGQTIFVRLRYGQDPRQFLAYDQIIDTLLHELSHIVWGPHDGNFHKLWDELREEYYALKRQGYTGEGFLGTGHRIGGRNVPLPEVRRQARIAAEKRRTLNAGSGQRLGGAPVPRGADMRGVIADAIARRNNIVQGCGSGNHEIEMKAEEEARRLGFGTKAEMDDADRLAIAIAMMEGDREANRQDMENLAGTSQEGLTWSPERGLEIASSAQTTGAPSSSPSTPAPKPSLSPTTPRAPPATSVPRPGKPVSRLVANAPNATRAKSAPEVIDLTSDSPREAHPSEPSSWTCEICTLVNDMQHLCCDACGIERPESVTQEASRTRTASRDQAPPLPARPLGWNCSRCGTFMENQWWTCSACGLMKSSS